MNKKKFEALSDKHKAIINKHSGMVLAKIAGRLWDEIEDPARKLAIEAGGKFFQLSGPPLENMKLLGENITKEWIKKAEEKSLNGKVLVKKAQSLISKYENE